MVSIPPREVLEVLFPQILGFLVSISRVEFPHGVRLTSWWRSAEDNRRVGGAPQSQHLLGLAFDIVVPGGSAERSRVIHSVTHAGLIGVDERSHVHVQAFPAGALAQTGFFREA